MAQSDGLKKLHERQVALAQEFFEEYKCFIAEEFMEKYRHAYQTVAEYKDIWRKAFAYTVEREQYIKFKTRLFLRMISGDANIVKNPRFLRVLIRKISEYLSVYTSRSAVKADIPVEQQNINRNEYANRLFQELFSNNAHVQYQTKTYTHKKERDWGISQKKKRERVIISRSEPEPVSHNPDQLAKNKRKKLNAKIREKKKEIIRLQNTINIYIK